jgi:autotransporter-associated beta strand protein
VLAPYGAVGTQFYNGVISGAGGIVQRGGCTTILAGANTYSGGTFPTASTIAFGSDTVGNVTSGPIGTGPLFVVPELPNATGSGTVLAYGGARTIANPIQYPSATNNQTLIIGGTNQLTFSGPIVLQGQDGLGTYNNRIFQANNTAPTIFSGVISDGGLGFGITKTGTNALYLDNGANTYTGPTTNSAGLLAGLGTLAGPVIVLTNASIGGGSAASIGTLTINGNLTLSGNVFIRLDKPLAQSNDVVSVGGTLANSGAGTVTVTNIGVAALVAGDRFVLFSKALANGGTLTVTGGLTAGLAWTNNLALDGSISVLAAAVVTPPVIIMPPSGSVVVQGGTATLSVVASTSTGTTNYQWQLNSNTITAGNASGLSTSALTITNFQAANVGYYRVVVSDGTSSTNSSNADLSLATAPTIGNSVVSGKTLTLQIPTQVGPTYLVQTNGNLASTNWQTVSTITGDGSTHPFSIGTTNPPQLFIRVKMQ